MNRVNQSQGSKKGYRETDGERETSFSEAARSTDLCRLKIKENEKENDATNIAKIEDPEKESNKCDLEASKDSDAKNHLDKEQKFDCDVCLYRSSIQQELKDHMSNRGHNKEQK